MLNKIKGLDNNQVQATIETIEGLIEKYKWHDRKIYPYSFGINVVKYLDPFKDFESYTYMSKKHMIYEINFFIDIVNKWIERETKKGA
ncbi:MAG: hypothetical protein J6M62_07245 [Selenomonadaceae bacterium]|nr:hypothetical protein [Selenomonadaceae bacterium]